MDDRTAVGREVVYDGNGKSRSNDTAGRENIYIDKFF